MRESTDNLIHLLDDIKRILIANLDDDHVIYAAKRSGIPGYSINDDSKIIPLQNLHLNSSENYAKIIKSIDFELKRRERLSIEKDSVVSILQLLEMLSVHVLLFLENKK